MNGDLFAGLAVGTGKPSVQADTRPIANNPPPPPHTPTSLTPLSLLRPLEEEVRTKQREAFQRVQEAALGAIGEPYFSEEGFILYQSDCLSSLQALSGTGVRVALTVTSPPYNIGKPYESVSAVEEYIDWSARWIDAVHQNTSPEGSFWLNLGYFAVPGKGRAVPIPYLLWDKTRFHLLQEIVWNYGAGVASKRAFSPRNEKWLFYIADEDRYTFNLDEVRDPNVKYPNQKKKGKFRCNPLGKNPSDVWQFPKVTTGGNRSSRERTAHPAQFPLGVVERIVRVSSNCADIVLDPFSGSASTGLAAVGSGRVFLGFEQREDYCEMSVQRFRKFMSARTEAERQSALLLNNDTAAFRAGKSELIFPGPLRA